MIARTLTCLETVVTIVTLYTYFTSNVVNCPFIYPSYINYLSVPFSAMTEDGYEAQFQVNHLSHFLLTLELLPIMLDTASNTGDCRIVFVSSRLHMTGSFTPGNMNAEEDYSRTKFYGNSKLYNVSYHNLITS